MQLYLCYGNAKSYTRLLLHSAATFASPNGAAVAAATAAAVNLLLLLLQTEMEDAVFIWCAEGSTRSSSSSSSSSSSASGRQHHPQYSSTTAAAAAAAAGAAAPVFVLDCLLPLEDTAASLAWLDTAGLPPLLAVGYASGLLELYSRDHRYGCVVVSCGALKMFN
jgi:hypothetical protein